MFYFDAKTPCSQRENEFVVKETTIEWEKEKNEQADKKCDKVELKCLSFELKFVSWEFDCLMKSI